MCLLRLVSGGALSRQASCNVDHKARDDNTAPFTYNWNDRRQQQRYLSGQLHSAAGRGLALALLPGLSPLCRSTPEKTVWHHMCRLERLLRVISAANMCRVTPL